MRVEFDDDVAAGAARRTVSAAEVDLPERMLARRPLTETLPGLYPLAVRLHRLRRRLAWLRSTEPWALEQHPVPLPVRITAHRSLLMRQLGKSEMWLQRNKVTNLRLASPRVDGLLIRPGETFSFNKVVGDCTRARGYVEGMRLSNGEARPGVGGGICQLANLLHWMILHSDLTVVERSEHSFDPFPDNGRVLPWGVGCSIVYNYVDLVVRNDTDTTFQLLVDVGPRYLEGELRADREQPYSYRIDGRHDEFLHYRGEYFRRNEIWRTRIDRRTGNRVGEELVRKNCAQVIYEPPDPSAVIEVVDR